MLSQRIEGATRHLGKSQGFTTLSIRDEAMLVEFNRDGEKITQEINQMVSAWEPTLEELSRLMNGAPIYLKLWGTQHPPVIIEVGEPPKEEK